MYMYIYMCVYIYTYIYTLGKMAHPSNPNPEKCSKFVPPDALKILFLVLPVFCFLCKKFSKLLKFTLQNTFF